MSKRARRPWQDAPQWLRCGAAVALKDGSMAQCGKAFNESWSSNPESGSAAHLCTQHMKMFWAGKPIRLHREGYPLAAWAIRKELDQ